MLRVDKGNSREISGDSSHKDTQVYKMSEYIDDGYSTRLDLWQDLEGKSQRLKSRSTHLPQVLGNTGPR